MQRARLTAWLGGDQAYALDGRLVERAGWLSALLCAGCALVTPLDPVRKTEGPTAGSSSVSGHGNCVTRGGADCDPKQACSCGAGEQCRFDDDALKMRCMALPTSAVGRAGSRCDTTVQCGPGLECSASKICVPHCASDNDCAGAGKCIPYQHPDSLAPIAAADACSRWCDPVAPTACIMGTSCLATGPSLPDPHATCWSIRPDGVGKVRGKACSIRDECAAGLACAEYGPRVCTPFCRTNDDCPANAKQCYLSEKHELIAKPSDPVGQCVIPKCNDETAGQPEPWTAGPVWTALELQKCNAFCTSSAPNCMRTMCDDSESWVTCTDSVVFACAAKPGSPCRTLYVAQVCCDLDDCNAAAFRSCANQQTACMDEALRTCAASN